MMPQTVSAIEKTEANECIHYGGELLNIIEERLLTGTESASAPAGIAVIDLPGKVQHACRSRSGCCCQGTIQVGLFVRCKDGGEVEKRWVETEPGIGRGTG